MRIIQASIHGRTATIIRGLRGVSVDIALVDGQWYASTRAGWVDEQGWLLVPGDPGDGSRVTRASAAMRRHAAAALSAARAEGVAA